ncbi:pseudouridine-5'-phosphate glycosidase [Kitasatospora sp. GP30]|uniref:Pseudouridine-5'-phosphate glycosidase n=1 Tax=Kitasatospora acidiphila TaxID=2567942 RepID=A0A540W6D2_9ACTN|nr:MULTISPECIES: pseudouridine-5'-phosphate glycosidase [Kitasatospora]MDH6138195.1 pseudouridine-5'-phosphate glycosidase [Kitasatospora sp. GP30]TQF04560.1 pseudouridine-5'-phosphate glycosidase [Kitasatospora acidiphila]
MSTTIPIVYSEEVREALHERRPVVALESNVITHGLKYPHNAETAHQVEAAVRKGGSVPATICIEDGAIRVGMTAADIERFASEGGIPKVSSRDLPVVLARGGRGATTVASSLVAAELAGIPFFSSAGLGGVHRGAETTMDISSDLIQLTRSKVAVVCAGAKMILDLALTMEYLETQCVPVIAHGSDDFPAFYCASSGLRAPHRIDDEDLIAKVVATHWAAGHPGGVVITTPPRDEDAVDPVVAEAAINDALVQAERDGVTGQGLTKYLMHAVDRATGGRTAQANMAVLISTAEVGGRMAAAYARYQSDHS